MKQAIHPLGVTGLLVKECVFLNGKARAVKGSVVPRTKKLQLQITIVGARYVQKKYFYWFIVNKNSSLFLVCLIRCSMNSIASTGFMSARYFRKIHMR